MPSDWHVSLTDETLIKDGSGDDVATTFFDAQDYKDRFEKRASDAEAICLWMNNGPRIASALSQLIAIAGFPVTDRQKAIFDEARAALHTVTCQSCFSR